MIVFWIAAAVLAAAALAFVLRPLLWRRERQEISRDAVNISVYRDQLRELDADLASGRIARADYERARREIEARVLEDVTPEKVQPAKTNRGLTPILLVAVPFLAAGVYLATGNPGAIDSPMQNLDTMVARLSERLKARPDDVEGWRLLGRSYAAMERFAESAESYARAAKLAPKNAEILADLADSLGMASGRTLQGDPEKLVLRALELDPNNLKALSLAGTAAYERKDFAAAAAYWQRILPHVDKDSEDAKAVQANIDEARNLLGGKSVKGTVSLSAKLKGQAAPEDTVFVFARAVEGPPLPLAVLRKQVKDLPLSFSLDDSMAMAPGMNLSKHPRVVVTARIAKAGTPTPQPGDLQGASKPVGNDATGVSVVIDSVVR
jgi:cytochrome c-type biogenesis protein CcmH